ncbi:calcium-binding protein [Mycobacterium sp. MFM001]|uniref:GmrSD restriction endonuclease domain-containing protein n=1 Tax=Mycobacterium sp. MFM001 TaxID=2049453 RepID=UPI000DA5112D|nr:calcium-binding protein [Mycobacterium sp. MFM001]
MIEDFANVKTFGKKRSALTAGAFIGALLLISALGHTGRVDSTSATASTPLTTAYLSPTTAWTTPLPPPLASPPASNLQTQPEALVDGAAASAKLAALPIKGRAPKTGYQRSLFGQAWSDDVTVTYGHNGCDTRNDILRRDLVEVELKPGSNGCTVLSGVLIDPYTGSTVEFHRGEGTSSRVQIDHVVALSDAWQKGAQQWDADKRRNFANDPANLQATTGSVNEQKGDGDAATWLPPNKSYRCTYVSRIVDVKATYGLWVTQAEHDAIAGILANCEAPAAVAAPLPLAPPPPETSSEQVPPSPVQVPDTGSSVYYPNCATARAAGAAPIYAGQPGYRLGLDRDGDGVACE